MAYEEKTEEKAIDPTEISTRIAECKRTTEELRKRWRESHGFIRGEKYAVDAKKGNFLSYTTNRGKTLGNRVIDKLATAVRKVSMEIETEKKKERENLALTEKAVIGAFNTIDNQLLAIMQPDLQSQCAYYTTTMGWICLRLLLREEEGKTIVDFAQWDPYSTYWGLGSSGMSWVAYERWASRYDVEELYPKFKNMPVDEKGRVKVTDYWMGKYEYVVINNDVASENEHGLDHPPILILPGGSVPFLQREYFTDTMKDVGPDIYENVRDVLPSLSKAMSYYETTVELGVMSPRVIYYKGGQKPTGFDEDPFVAKRVHYIDSTQVEKIEDFIKPVMPADAAAWLALIIGENDMGGRPPISHGEISGNMPAAAIALLIEAADQVLLRGRKHMETAFEWLAAEFVTQYKNGDYPPLKVAGKDSGGHKFDIEAKPADLIEDKKIEVELTPKMPLDAQTNAGVASTFTKAGLISKQRAMDKYAGVEDPDGEMEIIAREELRALFPGIRLMEDAAAYHKDNKDSPNYNPAVVQVLMAQAAASLSPEGNQPGQPGQPGGGNEAGVSRPVPPEAAIGRGMQVPGDVQNAMRLRKIGLEPGR